MDWKFDLTYLINTNIKYAGKMLTYHLYEHFTVLFYNFKNAYVYYKSIFSVTTLLYSNTIMKKNYDTASSPK